MMSALAMPTPPYSVLVVDDSAFMRKLIAEMISAEPSFHVAGFARNGVDALRQITTLNPDVVTLDLEMPQLDGMQVLEQLMARAPRRIVVLSAGGSTGSDSTIRALELGAVDFVQKPSGSISLDLALIRDRLIAALRTAVTIDMNTVRAMSTPQHTTDEKLSSSAPASSATNDIATHAVVVAASTGGPRALSEVIPALPGTLPAAVLVAQHMPREFTNSLAERLDLVSALKVREAVHGEPVRARHVYIAPGNADMRVAMDDDGVPTIVVEPCDGRAGVAPSADTLFSSAARAFGARVTAVVLTGMGRDGSDGARAVRNAHGRVIVQDRETSVIYGMPQAALITAGADHVLALEGVAAGITACVEEQGTGSARVD